MSKAVTGSSVDPGENGRMVAVLALALLAFAGVLGITAAPSSAADPCPNAQMRIGIAAELPDCRAYEKVSPEDKGESEARVAFGVDATVASQVSRAAADGEAVAYVSQGAFSGAASANFVNSYLARRTASGWQSGGIAAPQSPTNNSTVMQGQYPAFSADLSTAILSHTNVFGPTLAADAALGYANLYLRDNDSGAYTALTVSAPPNFPAYKPANFSGFPDYYPQFQGASADSSHVIFVAPDALPTDTGPQPPPPCAEGCGHLYEWTDGQLRLVNVLPNGTPTTDGFGGGLDVQAAGGTPAFQRANMEHAISEDGSRIYWSDNSSRSWKFNGPIRPGPPNIYLREDGQSTKPVGAGTFWAASPDGGRALYTSGVAPGSGDLFLFDAVSGNSTNLTPGGQVQGLVGQSEDLSYVYFVAGAALTTEPNSRGEVAQAGGRNVYLWRAGTTDFETGSVTFITTLPAFEGDASRSLGRASLDNITPALRDSYVTPDGRHMAFNSTGALTGFDSTPADPQRCKTYAGLAAPCYQVFLYDAEAAKLICASCNPAGEAPIGPANVPVWPNQNYAARSVSDDGGRVFFNSTDRLVSSDRNQTQDVYQWEADGFGSCGDPGGCISLISSGAGVTDLGGNTKYPTFVDASADGDDVFFTERARLVAQDEDGQVDLYNARVGGGFPAPVPGPGCELTGSCRGETGEAPAALPVGSAGLSGRGNVAESVGRVRVARRRLARGAVTAVRVRMPAAGRISIRGRGLRRAKRVAKAAGAYRLKVRLRPSARKRLIRRKRLRTKATVVVSLRSGETIKKRVKLNFKWGVH